MICALALFDAREPGTRSVVGQRGNSVAGAGKSRNDFHGTNRQSQPLAMYPEFVAEVEELSGIATGYRAKGTLGSAVLAPTRAKS